MRGRPAYRKNQSFDLTHLLKRGKHRRMIEIKRNVAATILGCAMGPACPAAYELSDGSLLLVGRTLNPDEYPAELQGRVADHETAVVIPPALLELKNS